MPLNINSVRVTFRRLHQPSQVASRTSSPHSSARACTRRVVLSAAVLCLGATSVAEAQICAGSAPQLAQISVSALATSGVHGFGARLGGNRGKTFGGISTLRDYASGREPGTSIGLDLGHTWGPAPRRATQVCPRAWAERRGGQILNSRGVPFATTADIVAVGLSVGSNTPVNNWLSVIPAFTLAASRSSTTFRGPDRRLDRDENYLNMNLALGAVFRRSFALRASASFPFGLNNVDPSAGLSVVVPLGR